MSTRTTSARPASAMRCAVVAPTLPAPMTVTLLRAMPNGAPFGCSGLDHCRSGSGLGRQISSRWMDVRRCPLADGEGTIGTDPSHYIGVSRMTLTPGLTLLGLLLVLLAIPL